MSNVQKTQMCKSTKIGAKCSYGKKCLFAHSKEELVILPCMFGAKCKLVSVDEDDEYTTYGSKVCLFIHPSEQVSNFHTRVFNLPSSPTSSRISKSSKSSKSTVVSLLKSELSEFPVLPSVVNTTLVVKETLKFSEIIKKKNEVDEKVKKIVKDVIRTDVIRTDVKTEAVEDGEIIITVTKEFVDQTLDYIFKSGKTNVKLVIVE